MANFSLSNVFSDPKKLQALSSFLLSFGQGTLAAGQRGLGVGAGLGVGFSQGGAGLTQFLQQQKIEEMRELQRKALAQQISTREAAEQRRGQLAEAAKLFVAGRPDDLGIGSLGRPVAPGSSEALAALASASPNTALTIAERGKDRDATAKFREQSLALQRERVAIARSKAGKTKSRLIFDLNNRSEALRAEIAKGGHDPERRAELGRRLKRIDGAIEKLTTVVGRTAQDVEGRTIRKEERKAKAKTQAEIKQIDSTIKLLEGAQKSAKVGVGALPKFVEGTQGILDQLGFGEFTQSTAKEVIQARQRIRLARESVLKFFKSTGRVAIQEQQRILELFKVLGNTSSKETAQAALKELQTFFREERAKLTGAGGPKRFIIKNGELVPK